MKRRSMGLWIVKIPYSRQHKPLLTINCAWALTEDFKAQKYFWALTGLFFSFFYYYYYFDEYFEFLTFKLLFINLSTKETDQLCTPFKIENSSGWKCHTSYQETAKFPILSLYLINMTLPCSNERYSVSLILILIKI